MKPYYADDAVTLYHGDCREVTEWLTADVLVTDPPYGRGWTSGGGMTNAAGQGRSKPHSGIANDSDTAVRDAALRLWGDRRAVVFGDPLCAPPSGTRQALVYAKPADAGVRGAHAGFRRNVEMIYLVGPWRTAIGGRSSVLTTNAHIAGPRGVSVRYEHPHAKPVDLLIDLLYGTVGIPHAVHVGEGEGRRTVLADPFAGSGSTLIAAAHLGMRAVGVEVDERYCEAAARRLAQRPLFMEIVP